MRLCRFEPNRLGVVEGNQVADVTDALGILPAHSYPFPDCDLMIANLDAIRARIGQLLPTAQRLPLASVKLASPVANPGKIVNAPINYQAHINEAHQDKDLQQGIGGRPTSFIGDWGLFLKANSALVGCGAEIQLRHPTRRNDHEVELALVIGKTARSVKREDALSYIAGYAIGLDMTVRGPEDRSFRKSPDTYAVLGPWLVTADEIGDPGNLALELSVNGELRQRSNTQLLVYDVPKLIEYASAWYTLNPGDIILTGTPDGVGPVKPGDIIHASIEKIGDFKMRVADQYVA